MLGRKVPLRPAKLAGNLDRTFLFHVLDCVRYRLLRWRAQATDHRIGQTLVSPPAKPKGLTHDELHDLKSRRVWLV